MKKDPKAPVDILDARTCRAATIPGTMDLVGDPEAKRACRSKAFPAVCPKGPTSPRQTVLHFRAEAIKMHPAGRNAPS